MRKSKNMCVVIAACLAVFLVAAPASAVRAGQRCLGYPQAGKFVAYDRHHEMRVTVYRIRNADSIDYCWTASQEDLLRSNFQVTIVRGNDSGVISKRTERFRDVRFVGSRARVTVERRMAVVIKFDGDGYRGYETGFTFRR